MTPKELITSFYASDVLMDSEKLKTFLHPDVILEWNSSTEFVVLDFDKIITLSQQMDQSYVRLKNRISHLIVENQFVSVRYASYAKTIENVREEMHIANFMVVWEIKDNKLYRGFQMSYLP